MKKYFPMLSVCIMSAMLMAALAVSPGIAAFISAYGISESLAMWSITLPYLVSIPFALAAGALSARFSKKAMVLAATAIIFFTGVIPYFLHSFAAVLAVRSLMGVGLGLLFTLAPSLAPDYYPPGTLRNLTVGLQSAWAGSGGVVFNILSGHLAASGQVRSIFLVYGICAVFFVLLAVLLPYQPPQRSAKASQFDPAGLKAFLMTLLFISAGMTLSLNAALYLAGAGIGSSVQAGYATSVYSAAAFILGCAYAPVARLLKKQMVFVACLVSAAGMLLCVAVPHLAALYAGAALVGAGLSMFMPSCVSTIFATVRPTAVPMSVAIMMVGSSVGQTFSAYFINPVAGWFSSQVQARFVVSAIVFAVVALLALAFSAAVPKTGHMPGDETSL